MKLKAKWLLFALVCVLMLALVACGKPGDDSSSDDSSSEEDSSSQEEVKKFTVTYHYGVAEWDAENGKVKTYAATKEVSVKAGGKAKDGLASGDKTPEGYSFVTWECDGGNLNKVTKNLDAYAKYTVLDTHTVTFKDANGRVISATTVYSGKKVDAADVPDTNGFRVYDAERYASLSDASKQELDLVEFKDANGNWIIEGAYIKASDKALIGKAVPLSFDSYFGGWNSDSSAMSSPNSRITANVTFTVKENKATAVVPSVGKNDVVIDGQKDAKYEKVGELYKYIISEKVTDAKQKNVDYTILDKYATKEAAAADNKGDEWENANTLVKAIGADKIHAELYMAWDGDWIYFLVDVNDPTVVTQGKQYCSINNPYENDGVEIWYAINGYYSKLCLDAMGYNLYSGATQPSAYLGFVKNNNANYQTSIKGGTKPTSDDPTVIANATGYIVEYRLPAYNEPTDTITADDPLGENLGGKHWGSKLRCGDMVHISLQVDSISAAASAESITQCVSTSGTSSLDSLGQKLNRINIGYQTNGSAGAGTSVLILG